MTDPLRLTDLRQTTSLVYRLRYSQRWLREWLRALPAPTPRHQPRVEEGQYPDPDGRRIALYAHYSASGRISGMVRRQLAEIAALGFAVVFTSAAPNIPDADWAAVLKLSALAIHRRNFGLDFGAWHDAVPYVRQRWPAPQDLLLANDSVLGPITPLAPLMAALCDGGPGLFGLTESREGRAHLQSYLLLASGARAVADLMEFLDRMRLTNSKWLLIQRGEVRLTRWMAQRGHRVAALFGHDRVAAGRQGRINPMHHLWRPLVTRFGCPFLKTELVLRNPWHIPDAADWPDIVPPDILPELRAHLDGLRSAQQEPQPEQQRLRPGLANETGDR